MNHLYEYEYAHALVVSIIPMGETTLVAFMAEQV